MTKRERMGFIRMRMREFTAMRRHASDYNGGKVREPPYKSEGTSNRTSPIPCVYLGSI